MAVTVPCGFCDNGQATHICGDPTCKVPCPYCEGTGQLPVNDDGYDPIDHPFTHGDSRFFPSEF